MIEFFLECAIRVALIVGATALVLYAMRVKVASVKHRVWTAVLLLMLALPLWIAWGPKAPIRILPANLQNFAADVFVQTPAPDVSTAPKSEAQQPTVPSPQSIFSTTEALLLSIYLFGAMIFLARLAIGTWKAGRLIRESSPSPELSSRLPSEVCRSEGSAVGFASLGGRSFSSDIQPSHTSGVLTPEGQNFAIRSSGSCAAPVTVGWCRPTILLPKNWREWSASQLAAVLAHEREHARRRDPLIQWLALFNRAIFWFHPAAWWLERELSALAEECCDAAVLAQGHDPSDYAETLMRMARAVMHSGSRISATGTAMPGPRLPQRIRQIVESAPAARISRARAACIVAVCAALCAAFFAVTLTRAQSSAMQDWEKAAGGKMAFEVASVKQNTSRGGAHQNFPLDDGGSYPADTTLLSSTGLPLSSYIAFAYKLPAFEQTKMEAQLPKWAVTERFDIQARAATPSTKDQMRLMMQSLLEDRFKLKAHFETHEKPLFQLVLVKPGRTGPQLRSYGDDPPCSTNAPASGPNAPS